MTSSSAEQPQLMKGDEDPYKSEGHIEFKLENLTGFVQQALNFQRYSEPVHVCGVPWRIQARLLDCGADGQKQKCLGYYLRCDAGQDPCWSYPATVQLKLQHKKGGNRDYIYKFSETFNGEKDGWGYPQYMSKTFAEIMELDRGFYDEQDDSITLAVDFTVNATADRTSKYVLVAENELKLDQVPTCFSMQIGQLEWEVNFHADDHSNKNAEKSVVLSCKDLAKARGADNKNKVLLELFGYHRNHPKSELYSPICGNASAAFNRHLFTRASNSLTIKIPGGRVNNNLLFTFRVFKERGQFPNFTQQQSIATATVGRNPANVALRLGDQQFHVNKQLLSSHSLFFDRMFHGDYTAATQQEVDISLNTHSPELFHQFLLVMCVNEVLPDSMNVAALFKLADFYDAENVRQKCDQHLRMAKEMPVEKRVLLARDHGTRKTQDLLMDSISFEQSRHIISNLVFMQNRSAEQ